MALTPRQKLEDFVECGDVTGWPDGYYGNTIAALAAMHIGDELRSLTEAISSAFSRPTEEELAEGIAMVKRLSGSKSNLSRKIAKGNIEDLVGEILVFLDEL